MKSDGFQSISTSDVAVQEPVATPPVVLVYWEIARRHLWLILAIVVGTISAGLVLTLLATPKYSAVARIEIQREQTNVTKVGELQPEQQGQSLEFYQTQYSLLGARSLAERVAQRLKLAQDDLFLETQGLDDKFPAGERLTALQLKEQQRDVIDALLDNVAINPARGSALIDVAYASSSPQLSARIANTWVREFISQSVDRRFASTSEARTFLETRLADLRRRLETSERDLVNYAESKNIVRLAETQSADGKTTTTQTLVGSDLGALNQELAAATADRIAAEGRVESLRARRSNGDTISNTTVNQLRQRSAELSAQHAQLMEQFEPEYPEARALQRQITAIEASIGSEERRVLDATATAHDAARQREIGLNTRVGELTGQLNVQNRAQIQYNIYQREVDTNRQLYDGLLQRYKEIGVAGVGASNVAIVDAAIVPVKPSSPNLPLNLALALLAGGILAAAAVFVLENLDEGIRTQQQVPELLGLPLLGTTPATGDDLPYDMIRDPKSGLSEAYMTVRTNLAFATDHGVPRSLAITSSIPGEGKTTSGFALALMLARTGKRVLLIDIDMRRPAVHKLLGIKNARGTSNYLAGDGAWQAMVQPTDHANLSVMPAGPVPPSAPELLSSDRLSQLVTALTGEFDTAIFDCPPLLGLSDVVLIGRAVEGVMLVVQASRVPVRGVRAALERIRDGRTRIFGAVLTQYRAPQSAYGYGYKYSDHYAYGRNDKEVGTA